MASSLVSQQKRGQQKHVVYAYYENYLLLIESDKTTSIYNVSTRVLSKK